MPPVLDFKALLWTLSWWVRVEVKMSCHFKMLLPSKRGGKSIFCAVDFCACRVSLHLLDHRCHTAHSIPRGFNSHWVYYCQPRSWTSKSRLYFLYAQSSMRMLPYVVQNKTVWFCFVHLNYTKLVKSYVFEKLKIPLSWSGKWKTLLVGKLLLTSRKLLPLLLLITNLCKIVQF